MDKLYICAKILDTELSISICKTHQDFSYLYIKYAYCKVTGSDWMIFKVPASSKTMMLLPKMQNAFQLVLAIWMATEKAGYFISQKNEGKHLKYLIKTKIK